MKIGRNDPCPCGSGKKYKNCHLPEHEAERSEELKVKRAVDSLMPKLLDRAKQVPGQFPDALGRFWEGKYSVEQLGELDDLEDRGADRFLTWFTFDYRADDGMTVVERAVASPEDMELSAEEALLLPTWAGTRLRPYVVESVAKGQSLTICDMLDETRIVLEDGAASRRVGEGEVLVMHMVPGGSHAYVGGASAHLTDDTREKLDEFLALHLEALRRDEPEATYQDLLQRKSEILNHFVSALPVETPDPTILENFVLQTRLALQLAGSSIGIGGKGEEASGEEQVVSGK